MEKHQGNAEKKIIGLVTGIAEEIAVNEGIDVVDVIYRREPTGWVLRVLIDKEGGITVDDCSTLSRELGDMLDVKDISTHAYKLEVSSPGLNRPLRKEHDFKRFLGETVKITTSSDIDGRKNFKGKLLEYRDGLIVLDVDGTTFTIAHTLVKKANLEYDFNKAARTPVKQQS